jgi:hypothetical protein
LSNDSTSLENVVTQKEAGQKVSELVQAIGPAFDCDIEIIEVVEIQWPEKVHACLADLNDSSNLVHRIRNVKRP